MFMMLSRCKPSATAMKHIENIKTTLVIFTVIECGTYYYGCVQVSISANMSKPGQHDDGII